MPRQTKHPKMEFQPDFFAKQPAASSVTALPVILHFTFRGQPITARLIEPASRGSVKVMRTTPPAHLSTRELVERVKAEGRDVQSSYGSFVYARNLQPEISMKEFIKIWKEVFPDPHRSLVSVPFRVTHYELLEMPDEEPVLVPACITAEDAQQITFLLDFGNGQAAAGGAPVDYFEAHFVPAVDILDALNGVSGDSQRDEDERNYNQTIESGLRPR